MYKSMKIHGDTMTRNRFFRSILMILLIGFISGANTVKAQEPVVHAVLFYSPTCGHCKIVIEEVLPDLDARYGSQFQVYAVNTHTEIGNQLYGNFVTANNIPAEEQGVPMLLVDDQILVGSLDIPELLPGIIDQGLSDGGIPWPELEGLQEAMAGTFQVEEVPETTTFPDKVTLIDKFKGDLAANSLAVIVLVGMIASLFIAGRNLIYEKVFQKELPSWLIPLLTLIGIGIAAYLSFVEFTDGEAVCGPVGNCNAVQQSSFATLFGILPVGIAGLLGYLGILLAWFIGELPKTSSNRTINLIMWGFTLIGLLFSIYLTFLEPFVIGATCMWCLSSAVIMTALFLITSRRIKFQETS
jgi:uncharacterized membrane protein